MRPEERAFLERARVGVLTTVDGDSRPHAVPICFAIRERDGEPRLVSAIDEKPKSTRDLRRVRNIESNPRVTALVHRYSEDWSRLAWVQVRGRAKILRSGATGHDEAVRALESAYEQYAEHELGDRPIIEMDIGSVLSWGPLEEP